MAFSFIRHVVGGFETNIVLELLAATTAVEHDVALRAIFFASTNAMIS